VPERDVCLVVPALSWVEISEGSTAAGLGQADCVTLRREWRPALKAAKIANFRFHVCRHTFASRLAMSGVDLYTVQRAGGWKTQAMVERYAHLSPDHLRGAVERLANLRSSGGTRTKTGTH
jgi:integrase